MPEKNDTDSDLPAISVPNLDCMDRDDLLKLGEQFRERASLYTKLSQYCRRRALAMEYRFAGKIGLALANENMCDRIYADLPPDARW